MKIEIENGQLLIETVKHVMEEDLVDVLECEIDEKVRKVKNDEQERTTGQHPLYC